MIITLFAPELVAAKALSDMVSATVSCKCISVWAKRDRVLWTLGHSLFVDMGGFAVRFTPNTTVAAKLEI